MQQVGIKEDQAAGKLKGQNRTTQRSAASLRRGRGGWASLAKRQSFTFLYLLYFLGVAAELGVHHELCLGQLRLCNTVPFLYKFKGLCQVGKPTIFLCVLCFT